LKRVVGEREVKFVRNTSEAYAFFESVRFVSLFEKQFTKFVKQIRLMIRNLDKSMNKNIK